MEVCVNDAKKSVEVWLTGVERDDPVVRDGLKPLYQTYHQKNYQIAVFLSGDNPLYPLTRDLLVYNRKRIAQLAQ